MKGPQKRQIRRLERIIDELVKIHDDGQGDDTTMRMLEMANSDRAERELSSS